jgi:hypothetical protein
MEMEMIGMLHGPMTSKTTSLQSKGKLSRLIMLQMRVLIPGKIQIPPMAIRTMTQQTRGVGVMKPRMVKTQSRKMKPLWSAPKALSKKEQLMPSERSL